MNVTEKIEAAGKKKEEGNALFKVGKYARASKRYEKVVILRKVVLFFNFSIACQCTVVNLDNFHCRLQSLLNMTLLLVKRRRNSPKLLR